MKEGFDGYLDGLSHSVMNELHLYYSSDCRDQARVIGRFASQASAFLQTFFKGTPDLVFLVLNPGDWKKRVSHQPYGDPFVPDVRVHYGIRPPDRWKTGLVQLVSSAPPNLRKQVFSLSSSRCDNLDEALDQLFTLRFFAATVAHEMAHPFLAVNLVLPQPLETKYAFKLDGFWLAEFLPQCFMYSFLQATDKALGEKWLILMNAAFEGGRSTVNYRNLRDMGPNYLDLARSSVENILWYQAKLFVMASTLHRKYGDQFLLNAVEDLRLSEKFLVSQLMKNFRDLPTWLQQWK